MSGSADAPAQHMNHGPDFQALWSQLRKDVVALQAKGYYGDGNDQLNI
jgi:DNA-dependent metalloprotease WSS1